MCGFPVVGGDLLVDLDISYPFFCVEEFLGMSDCESIVLLLYEGL